MSPDELSAPLRPLDFAGASEDHLGLSAAERERLRAKTQGYAEGYAAGMRAVTEQTRAQREQIAAAAAAQTAAHDAEQQAAMGALVAAARAFDSRVLPLLESADRSLIESALALAEAVLGYELCEDQNAAAAALERVIGAVDTAEIRGVRMHPRTAAALPTGAAETAGVSIVADPGMAPGDAVADLHEGFIDARITAALRRCHEILDLGGEFR